MRNKKRERSSNLTDADIARITSILDGWSGKITWDMLILEIKLWFSGQVYTRQALSKHPRIKTSYDLALKRWRNTRDVDSVPKAPKSSPVEMKLLMQENEKLKAENSRLEQENADLLAQFARWQYNADVKGITKAELDEELPYIDRRKTIR
jgi:hypothetical protein